VSLAVKTTDFIISNPKGPYKQIIDVFPLLVLIGKQRSSLGGQMADSSAPSGALINSAKRDYLL
jgi:hypothetical protein